LVLSNKLFIFVSGASSSGKTTIVNDLYAHLTILGHRCCVYSEIARYVFEKRFKETFGSIDKLAKDSKMYTIYQQYILCETIDRIKEIMSLRMNDTNIFIFDRHPIETIAYTLLYSKADDDFKRQFVKTTLELSYSMAIIPSVCFLVKPLPFVNDGVRIQGEQKTEYRAISYLLSYLPWLLKYQVT